MDRFVRYLPSLCLVSLACIRSQPSSKTSDAPNAENSARNFGSLESVLSRLPLSGRLSREPWSDTYWPNVNGGISNRWMRGEEGSQAFLYEPLALSQLKQLTREQIKLLSPAEKYDIYMGKTSTYPTVDAERGCKAATDESWEGMCHAWSPAALLFQEPKPVEVKSRVGDLKVQFASSDIKALLIAAMDYTMQEGGGYPAYHRIGGRCNGDSAVGRGSQNDCLDVNAGSFHIVMANLLQPGKKGFVIDRDATTQVWNQPAYAYSSQILSRRDASESDKTRLRQPSLAQLVQVKTALTWVGEVSAHWEAHGEGNALKKVDTYTYTLELDSSGRIIGGEWDNTEGRFPHPDFVWMAGAADFNQTAKGVDLSGVMEIYRASVGEVEPPPDATPTPAPQGPKCEPMNYEDCFNSFPRCYWKWDGEKCLTTTQRP